MYDFGCVQKDKGYYGETLKNVEGDVEGTINWKLSGPLLLLGLHLLATATTYTFPLRLLGTVTKIPYDCN